MAGYSFYLVRVATRFGDLNCSTETGITYLGAVYKFS